MDLYTNYYCETEKTYHDIFDGICEVSMTHGKEKEQVAICKDCIYFITGDLSNKKFKDAKNEYRKKVRMEGR